MKKSTFFIVMALLCLKFNAFSQSKGPFSTESRLSPQLEIGAKLPNDFWTNENLFYAKGKEFKQDLFQYKNKIVILDFWATWCGSCVKKLPLLDSLQKAYPDELAIIPISSTTSADKMENIEQVFLGKRKPFQPLAIPTIINDKKLWALFPHHALSHVVWIQDGRVLSVTGGDFLYAPIIEKLIMEQRALSVKEKKTK